MDPLLRVIITCGLIFVVTAMLGQGLGVTRQSITVPLRAHSQLSVMLLISTFIVVPAVLIGLAAVLPFDKQVDMAIVVLAICGGTPFVPFIVSVGHGNLGLSVAAAVWLALVSIVVLPLAVPPLLDAFDTGADPSAWRILWPLLVFMLLPFVIGIVIRARSLSLTMALGSWLGPVSVTFLLVHITLYIGYSWDEFVSIAGYGQMTFALAFPLVGMLVGYLLSPPYVLSPVRAANPHWGSKIVSMVAVAEQNTAAVICCAMFAFGDYEVAGDYMLLVSIVTMIVVLLVMAELGGRFEKIQGVAPASPGAHLLVGAHVEPGTAPASSPSVPQVAAGAAGAAVAPTTRERDRR